MRLLVCGGRDYADREKVFATLDAIHAVTPVDLVIEGGASGADKLAFDWAAARTVGSLTLPADWSQGRKAGPLRNARLLSEGKPDMVIAFAGGKGTADMVRRAKKSGLEVREIG